MGENKVMEPLVADNAENAAAKQETLEEIIAKPLTEEEARKMVAEIDIQVAQLAARRVAKTLELTQIDYQLEAARFDRAVIYRRTLNGAPEEK